MTQGNSKGVTAAYVPLQWAMADDESRWTAELPDGRTAVIERTADGGKDGNGAVFAPSVGDKAGPPCDGLLWAAAWVDGVMRGAR